MALGRLFHYAVDAVLVSTVLAGVRRSSGFTYVQSISEVRVWLMYFLSFKGPKLLELVTLPPVPLWRNILELERAFSI